MKMKCSCFLTRSGDEMPDEVNQAVIRILDFCITDIEEEQTTQWPKQKVQKDKQRSTKHINLFFLNNP
jgi:hypothetical protein